MADLGLTRALRQAIRKGSKGTKVVRPEEAEALTRQPKDRTQPPDPALQPAVEPATEVTTTPLTEEERIVTAAPAEAPVVTPAAQPAIGAPTVPKFQLPGDLEVEAARLSKVKLADYDLDESFQPNFDKINTFGDTKAIIAELAQRNAGRIDEARRGVITNEQLRALADDLDVDGTAVRRVMERETGGVLNPETIVAARQMVNSSADRIAQLRDRINSGNASDVEKLMFMRQVQFHGDFFTQFMGARAESGRALNAFRSPLGLNAAQLARMKEVVERLQGQPEQLAKALAEVNTAAGISKFARGYNKSRVWGTLNELFVNSILSGPKTALVNAMGNALFQTMNIAETAVAARLGKFLPGDEHVQVGEAAAMVHGTLSGVRDGLRLAAKAFKNGRTLDDMVKFDTPVRRAISSENLLPPGLKDTPLAKFVDGLGTFIRLPTERVIAPTDEFFKTIAYRADLERQAMLHAQEQLASGSLKSPDDAIKAARQFLEEAPTTAAEGASEYARYAAFQNKLGETGAAWERALRSWPPLTLLAPFIRTPVNIFKAGLLERSPLALFSRKFWADMKAGGRQRDMALARVTMGSLTSAYIAYETLQGSVTGGGPTDDAARQVLQAQGWQPYSIRWVDDYGDIHYTSYARLEPIAFVLGATADTVEIMSYLNSDVETMKDEESQAYNAAAAVIAGIANNTMSKTFTKGLADFSELMSDPKRYVKQWAGQMATSFIPYSAMRRQIGQIEDPYLREAWTLVDKLKTASGIPGWSKDAPPRRDIYGKPRKVAAGDLLGPMSPIPSTVGFPDFVNDELVRVMEQTRQVPVAMPGKTVEGMRLTAKEYDDLVRISRTEPIFGRKRTFYDELERTMESATYDRATPFFRAELLKDVQLRADEIAKPCSNKTTWTLPIASPCSAPKRTA
jgi:hypothetical protein